jgi:hypothetical protein
MTTISKTIKNKSGIMLALLFMLILGAGTIMAMKAPGKKDGATVSNKAPIKKKTLQQWHYIPATSTGENNSSNYELASGSENCPGSTSVRCVIEAPDNGSGQPDLSDVTELTFKN